MSGVAPNDNDVGNKTAQQCGGGIITKEMWARVRMGNHRRR